MREFEKINDGRATFTVQVQFQQNETWQGVIAWVEGMESRRFRSELELIRLMAEAVEHSDEKEEQDTH